jgi:hypothetical protein
LSGPPNPIFFLDRNQGKALRRLLTSVGFRVIIHDHYFGKEEKDPVWIARCGLDNWVVLSGDKAIERVPENRQAVIDAKCKVIFFKDTNSRSEEWGAAVIVGRQRLLEIIHGNNGPLFVTIDKHARSHISSVRFAADGGPKPPQPAILSGATTVDIKPAEQPTVPEMVPEQGTLFRS